VDMASAAGATEAMARLSERVLDCAGLPESVTCRSSAALAAALGVPVIVPLAARVRPAGSAPLASAQ
jgi:hypothetical protein